MKTLVQIVFWVAVLAAMLWLGREIQDDVVRDAAPLETLGTTLGIVWGPMGTTP